MTEQETPEKMAARLMEFRHTKNGKPPKDVVENGVPIEVTEDSTMMGLASQIRAARNKG